MLDLPTGRRPIPQQAVLLRTTLLRAMRLLITGLPKQRRLSTRFETGRDRSDDPGWLALVDCGPRGFAPISCGPPSFGHSRSAGPTPAGLGMPVCRMMSLPAVEAVGTPRAWSEEGPAAARRGFEGFRRGPDWNSQRSAANRRDRPPAAPYSVTRASSTIQGLSLRKYFHCR